MEQQNQNKFSSTFKVQNKGHLGRKQHPYVASPALSSTLKDITHYSSASSLNVTGQGEPVVIF